MKNRNHQDPLARAQQHWGPSIPDWVKVLALEVRAKGQRVVATKLGITTARITQVLGKHSPNGMEGRVRSQLMGIKCPLNNGWPITAQQCQQRQDQGYVTSNPITIKESMTCQSCQNNGSNSNG
ncbi:hypothetical protein [Magnetococcus sp. PR-3]|uniref:hypothetical protein n=1 Tax=Magnetococcus sp. PR-3 TaxID=3120355 RepID=UPI002FCE2F91